MQIISLARSDVDKILAWVIDRGFYKKLIIDDDDRIEELVTMPIANYKNYDHFVGVMGKFNPYTDFFETIREVDFTYDALELELIKIRKEMKEGGGE